MNHLSKVKSMKTNKQPLTDKLHEWWNGETLMITEPRITTIIIDPAEPVSIDGQILEKTPPRKIGPSGNSVHANLPQPWLLKILKERNPKKNRDNMIEMLFVCLGANDYVIVLTRSNHKKPIEVK
jgi:hypothetical protein